MKKLFIAILSVSLLSSCNSDEHKSEDDILSDTTVKQLSIPREILDEMMASLPQPTEIANIISLVSDKEFSIDILIPSKKASQYTSRQTQALALGAYGVDLGYININDKTLYTIEYLQSVRTLSKEIHVDQFFDFEMMQRLSKNQNNVDSLIYISTLNFQKIDSFLRDNNKGDLSVMLLVGAWLEGMHMYGEIAKASSNPDINNMIGEQKIVFDNVYAILSKFNNNEFYIKFHGMLEPLKKSFDDIKISYEYKEPEMKEVDGKLVVVDNTTTTIQVTKEQVAAISKEIEIIRNKLLIQ
jgi:hypothetical protein